MSDLASNKSHSETENTTRTTTTSVFGASRQMLGQFAQMLQTRLSLAGIELAEEKGRIVNLALLGGLCLLFAFLALVTLTVLIAVLSWEQCRWQALTGLTIVYALLGVYCYCKVRRSLRNDPILFSETFNELKKDFDVISKSQ